MADGYIDPTSREFVQAKSATLLALAARTASADGAWIDVGNAHTLRLDLTITANSGTDETLDVTIQTRRDANDTARTLGTAFTQATDDTDQRKVFAGLDRQVRASTVIGGTNTPSFTFSVAGELVG